MATPLLWTRQPDTIGVARARPQRLRASATATGGARADPRAARGRARPLARRCPRSRTRASSAWSARTTFRLVHLADILAVTSRCLSSRSTAATHARRRAGRAARSRTSLRDDLGLTGTKIACGEGHCGACTVQLDGVPVLSCITLVHTVGEREVTTIEGLRDHPLVDAFVRTDALQCGFCTPGQIVSAAALVEANPEPTREEIRHAMAGNLCRCGTYPEDRGGDAHVARLIRTEKEVEGRYEEHVDRRRGGRARPVARRAAARSSAGRRRARTATSARAARRATPPTSQLPGMLHAAVLRSPHAHARVKRLDLTPALEAPGVRGRDRARRLPRARRSSRRFQGAPVAAVAADTPRQARARARR